MRQVLGLQRLVVAFELEVPVFKCQFLFLDFRCAGPLLSQLIFCLELHVLKLCVAGALLCHLVLSLNIFVLELSLTGIMKGKIFQSPIVVCKKHDYKDKTEQHGNSTT